MLENLSLWLASFVLWAGEQEPMYWVAVGTAGLLTGFVTYWVLGWMRRPKGKITFKDFDPVTDRPACTRREDLDEVVAGRMEWDTYVARHTGLPEDGSLRAEQPKRPSKVVVWFPREKQVRFDAKPWKVRMMDEVASLPQSAWRALHVDGHWHRGQRISRARVRQDPLTGLAQIFQPQSKVWISPSEFEIITHPCCHKDYVYVTSIHGKPIA